MALTRARFVTLGAAGTAAVLTGRRGARAADAKRYSFGARRRQDAGQREAPKIPAPCPTPCA